MSFTRLCLEDIYFSMIIYNSVMLTCVLRAHIKKSIKKIILKKSIKLLMVNFY